MAVGDRPAVRRRTHDVQICGHISEMVRAAADQPRTAVSKIRTPIGTRHKRLTDRPARMATEPENRSATEVNRMATFPAGIGSDIDEGGTAGVE
ncbi:hypothetical protein GCM10010109_53350 [Actinoplanes campanulatus]|nr:hypothetical protein GCM10010109_53350 [Actinoplanes campanulatus]GID40030.1 hypothetical protein Aca09nite_65360 [Actinoplanes campanulatus]